MESEPPRHKATVSTELLTRIIILMVAVWDTAAGLVLVGFHGASTGALGAGVEDPAGQRLLGAHLLVLVPAFVIIAVRLQRYVGLLWLPFASQAAVVLVVGYNMLKGDTSLGNGILAFAVSLIFVTLLGFSWVTEQRTTARLQLEAQEGQQGRPGSSGPGTEPPDAEA
jgi:hypothetical protein